MGAIVSRIKEWDHLMAQAEEVLGYTLDSIAPLPGLLAHKVGV